MLSFLREQKSESLIPEAPNLNPDTKGGSSPPDEQEYLTVATKNKSVRKSTFLLAILFGIGLLCLLFMIKKSAPEKASSASVGNDEMQIETAITRLTGVRSIMFDGLEKIVNKFYEFSDVHQIKVSELQKNPFKVEMFSDDLKKKPTDNWQLTANNGWLKNLELLSIMQSDQPSEGRCCMINDKILYEGDSIMGFKVRQISDNFVKLEPDGQGQKDSLSTKSEDSEIILKLSE
jgi:preprotein translocase subunit SecG